MDALFRKLGAVLSKVSGLACPDGTMAGKAEASRKLQAASHKTHLFRGLTIRSGGADLFSFLVGLDRPSYLLQTLKSSLSWQKTGCWFPLRQSDGYRVKDNASIIADASAYARLPGVSAYFRTSRTC